MLLLENCETYKLIQHLLYSDHAEMCILWEEVHAGNRQTSMCM